jgi:hypothetical protein
MPAGRPLPRGGGVARTDSAGDAILLASKAAPRDVTAGNRIRRSHGACSAPLVLWHKIQQCLANHVASYPQSFAQRRGGVLGAG